MYKVKIYDGVTIDMSTSNVIKTGRIRYIDSSDISYCGGGGDKQTSTSVSGYAPEFKPQITQMLNTGQGLYDAGQLGAVAGFTPTQLAAQQAGIGAAGTQTTLEQSLANTAAQGVNLGGMRTGAKQSALQALGMNAAGAGRAGGLGGSRQYLNQQSIANDLAGKFGQIDLQAQQQNFSNIHTFVISSFG